MPNPIAITVKGWKIYRFQNRFKDSNRISSKHSLLPESAFRYGYFLNLLILYGEIIFYTRIMTFEEHS